jgi:hypothetical protein
MNLIFLYGRENIQVRNFLLREHWRLRMRIGDWWAMGMDVVVISTLHSCHQLGTRRCCSVSHMGVPAVLGPSPGAKGRSLNGIFSL